MDALIQKALKGDYSGAVELLAYYRYRGFYKLAGVLLAHFTRKAISKRGAEVSRASFHDEAGIIKFYNGDPEGAFQEFLTQLADPKLSEGDAKRAWKNCSFSIPQVKDRYLTYPIEKVAELTQRMKKGTGIKAPFITLTITSCKRLDLFTKTVNSLLNTVSDLCLVDRFMCVDDNSSPEDRKQMKALYPFFDFYFKTPAEKGHPQSMNIILRETVDSAYLFHLEDDWQWFVPGNYLTQCLEVVNSNPQLGQCCVNNNYAETEKNVDCAGGHFRRTARGSRYYLHEHTRNAEESKLFDAKYPGQPNCSYWPHYSLRPSLIRRDVLSAVGTYHETVSHFEMEYAYRYVALGYQTAFLEGIYCYHIGRLTSERGDLSKPNAYDLNGEAQFAGKEEKLEANRTEKIVKPEPEIFDIVLNLASPYRGYIVNLDKRPDRMKELYRKTLPVSNVSYKDLFGQLHTQRFAAIEGVKIPHSHQLQRLCLPNDFGWRAGMIGCGYSHIKIWLEEQKRSEDQTCTAPYTLVLEDDVDLAEDFETKLAALVSQLDKLDPDWDLLYLGHSHRVYQPFQPLLPLNRLQLQKKGKADSFACSLGGTFGYLLKAKSTSKLLKFVETHGFTNGIDWVMMNANDALRTYYLNESIVHTEAWRGSTTPDSDIQYSVAHLRASPAQILKEEQSFYERLGYRFTVVDSELAPLLGELPFSPERDILLIDTPEAYALVKEKLIVFLLDSEIPLSGSYILSTKASNGRSIIVSLPESQLSKIAPQRLVGRYLDGGLFLASLPAGQA